MTGPRHDPHGHGATDAVRTEYARIAADYERRWAFYLAATTRETLARLELQAGDRVLDVGCGTGYLLNELARRHPVGELAGVDPVPEMLAQAEHRLPGVTLRDGRAEALPFADDAFDVAISCNMFHYIADPAVALDEIRRVLRPGGTLLLTDWCHDYLACRALGLYLRLLGRSGGRIHSERDCQRRLREAGFHVCNSERYRISRLWGLMTLTAVSTRN